MYVPQPICRGRNRDADVENGTRWTRTQGRSVDEWRSINKRTLSGVGQRAGERVVPGLGKGWRRGRGRRGMYKCADLHLLYGRKPTQYCKRFFKYLNLKIGEKRGGGIPWQSSGWSGLHATSKGLGSNPG